MKKAVFFDRDGVINVDHGYVATIKDFEFVDGIFTVMRTLQAMGYCLVIVTNQSGIGRGYYTERDFKVLNDWMLGRFESEGIKIGGVYYCPHGPESGCGCRKPAPGLFLNAMRDHEIDPAVSWMVGDKESDMVAAERAGITGRVLIGDGASEHCTVNGSSIESLLAFISGESEKEKMR